MNPVKKEVQSKLIKMIIPALSGLIITFLFQLVDTYYIGQLGAIQLTAISFTYPIYIALISIFIGLATGVGAAVGKVFGEKNSHKVKEMTTVSILLAFIGSILVCFGAYFVRIPIYSLLGAKDSIIPYIDQYMTIIIIGFPALFIALSAMATLRATGKALIPDVVMGISGIINIVLDYYLIFGVGQIAPMGIKGAAVATVVSWIFVLIVMLCLLVKHKHVTLLISIRHMFNSASIILKIGIPAIGVQLITPVALGLMTKFVSYHGTDAIAAFGIATKIESLSLTLILAMGIVLVPITAQHYGANEKEHLDHIVVLSGKMSTYWSILLYIVIFFFSKSIASIFTDSQEIIDIVATYLKIMGISYPLYGITLITNSLFNAVEKSIQSLKITIVKYVIILVPALFIGNYWGLNGLWLTIMTTHILGGLFASNLFRSWLKEQGSAIAEANLWSEYSNDFKRLKRK